MDVGETGMPPWHPGPAGPSDPLFPTEAQRLAWEIALSQWLDEARAERRHSPVAPGRTAAQFRAELAAFDFSHPIPLETVLRWTIATLQHGIVQIGHPRYFGLFNPTPVYPAECADRIAGLFNPQLASATTSPFPVALEQHVLESLCRRAGMPAGAGGHFTSGGSEANAAALTCALTQAHPDYPERGARALPGQPRLYVSRDAHLAWLKIAHEAGIGRAAVRLVATDGAGRIDPGSLAAAIAADRARGDMPVMIVATAGTTGAGMVDPLAACRELADRHGAWLHVDAAWAGAALASETLRAHLAGIEAADSITIDAHKWFATTMGCGMFLARDPAAVHRAFAVAMPCMPSCDPHLDPYVNSAQWSRRFLGLRLFLALAAAGWQGYADYLERAVSHADIIAARLEAAGWRQLNRSPFAVLCMAPPSGSARAIAQRVVASGRAWISRVGFEGQEVVRICVTSGETTTQDIDVLVASLLDAARAESATLSIAGG